MQKFSASIFIILYIVFVVFSIGFCGVCFSYPKKFDKEINKACLEFNISKPTFYALVNTESSFNPSAQSHAGAIGLTQILPSTAQYICTKNNLAFENFNLYSIEDNLYLGAMYLKYLFNKFEDKYTALSAYNAGETTVRNWLKNPKYSADNKTIINIPYKETKNYINKIKNAEKIYSYFYKIK